MVYTDYYNLFSINLFQFKRQVNPFDSIELKPSDFWEEEQDSAGMVESIHQEAIDQITELLNLVAEDHRSRTVLVTW